MHLAVQTHTHLFWLVRFHFSLVSVVPPSRDLVLSPIKCNPSVRAERAGGRHLDAPRQRGWWW
jgi:hypothetical protein